MTTTGRKAVGAALVQVTSLATRAVMSDESGRFTISGVPGGVSVNVTATKTGYLTATRTVTLTADTHVDIEVVRSPVFRLSGAVYEETPAGRIPIEGVHVEDSRVHHWSEPTGMASTAFPTWMPGSRTSI